ncbi:MAG: adenosine kinase [Gemmataceae bacterium]
MREFQLYGLGNALVDIFIELSDAEFAALEFERGSMRLVEPAEQKALLDRFHSHDPRLVSGGSVANSVIAFSQLGGDAAFLGCVGDDRYGLFYKSEFDQLGVDLGNPIVVDEPTGTCACLITPDAERTMRTCLAVSSLSAKHVDEVRLRDSEWLFIEGYVFANPHHRPAIREAIRLARSTTSRWRPAPKRSWCRRSASRSSSAPRPTCCSATPPRRARDRRSAEEAFARLRDKVPAAVVTDWQRHYGDKTVAHVPAFRCEPVDLTGSDMLAGAFLYGITHDVARKRRPRRPVSLAMGDLAVRCAAASGGRNYWDECPRPDVEAAMSVRTFVAVELEKGLRWLVAYRQRLLAPAATSSGWRHNLHCPAVPRRGGRARGPAPSARRFATCARVPAFLLALGVGCFPPRRPRGVGRGRRRRAELVAHDALEEPLMAARCYRREEQHTPHITLRTSEDRPAARWAAGGIERTGWQGGECEVSRCW